MWRKRKLVIFQVWFSPRNRTMKESQLNRSSKYFVTKEVEVRIFFFLAVIDVPELSLFTARLRKCSIFAILTGRYLTHAFRTLSSFWFSTNNKFLSKLSSLTPWYIGRVRSSLRTADDRPNFLYILKGLFPHLMGATRAGDEVGGDRQ